MWIVRFEMVSPVDHPEYYENEQPIAGVQDVLPEDFKAVAVTHVEHANAVEQFRGLKQLARDGELVRNIKLRPVVDLEPTDWAQVSDHLEAQMHALAGEVADAEVYSGQHDRRDQPDQGSRNRPHQRPEGR